MTKLWDISQTLRPGMPVWPGDTAVEVNRVWAMERGAVVNVAKIILSTHTGTHADAPLHYSAEGASIAMVSLEPYLGPCLVVDVSGREGPIEPEEIESKIGAIAERVLFRTFSRFPHDRWVSGFRRLSPEIVDFLAARGARLVGTDTPSLDAETSKTLPAHMAVRRHGLAILEGLVLDGVPAGKYELIALPLKLDAADASPVRAVLRSVAP